MLSKFYFGPQDLSEGPKSLVLAPKLLLGPKILVWTPKSKKVLCDGVARLPDPKILTFEGLQAKAMAGRFVLQECGDVAKQKLVY